MKPVICLAALLVAGTPAALAQAASPTGGHDYQEDVYVTPYWTRMPVIEAIGRANMQVLPNRATFSATFLEEGKNANDTMKLAVERAKRAYDAAKSVAGDAAIVETSVTVEPYYEQYRDKEGYKIENDRADKILGYSAQATLDVTVEDIALAGRARAGVLALSPEISSDLSTFLQATTEMNRAAYEAAVADGAARAKATASAAGSTLGKLLAVQEGSGPCLGRWTTNAGIDSTYINNTRSHAPAPMEDASGTRSLATVTVTASKRTAEPVSQAEIDALDLPTDLPKQTISSSVCLIYAVGD